VLNIIGKPFSIVYSEEQFKAAKKLRTQIIKAGTYFTEELWRMRKDGSIFPSLTTSTVIKDDKGKQLYIASTVMDITERKQAEERIKRAAEEWRTTFDSITDLVSIHDKDFRLVRVNKAFADVLNMKPEELLGKTCYQVVHGTNEPVPSCPHMKTLETKKPAMEDFFEPHLGIHLEVATSPVFNEKGEVVASVHVARDITERKKMEEQLVETSTRRPSVLPE